MKKNILAVAIAGAMVAPLAANAAAPTLYGQMNIAVDSVSENGNAVVNRNSRLGLKGSEDLGNGLKAVYQFETTLNANGSGNGFGGQRNTFVGVAGGFGTVFAGRHDTPLRMIQPSDRFNDSAYLGNNTGRFGGLNVDAGTGDESFKANISGEDRLDNMVAYISPKFNDFQVIIGGVSTTSSGKNDQAIGNAYSASLAYGSKRSGLFAAVGLTQRTDKLDTTTRAANSSATPPITGQKITEVQNTRAVVQYSADGLVVSAMYNAVDAKEIKASTATTLGAAYTMGAFTPKAKVSMVNYGLDEAKDSTNYAIGLDYALGKKTRAVVEYGVLDKNNLAGANFNAGKSTDVFTVGLHHAF